jgi:hypothetical protein
MRHVREFSPTRLPLRFACLVLGAATLATASCTLLVQFHDEASCDGGLCGDDATAWADASDEASAFDAADAHADAPDHYAPCAALANGHYCATDHLHSYAGSPADLVACADGGIGSVTHCDGGCVSMPDPFPDACNPCVGKPDGLYCGRDLAGFPSADGDFLIQCQAGNVAQNVACAAGCKSNGTSSSCY